MGVEDLKNRERFQSTVKKEYMEILRELAQKERRTLSKLADEAFELLFKSRGIDYKKERK